MTCRNCRHTTNDQATFCSRCGTRFGPPHRSIFRDFLITRVARPWWRFISEAPVSFFVVGGCLLLLLTLRAALNNFSPHSSPPGPASLSSSTAGSKENFTKAINAHLTKQCIEISPNLWKPFPVSIANDDTFLAQYNVRYKTLAKAGLLSATDTLIDKHQFKVLFSGFKASLIPKPKVPGHIYALTDLGRRALKNPKGTTFCAGHYQVDEITNFTMLGSAIPKMISEVNYTYSPSEVPAWALTSDMQSAFPELVHLLVRKQQGRITLVLTNNGWQVEADAP